ncbi:AraC family transcriptional regulator [Luteolibacter sp. GHJ8]|uniref:AraC family transcriptional regulator n=1 Tax=Luteolibacter rhizosphaerae TaxID=2989719 RepID=A0ABT3G3H9_9BACT|nr:AraC family transcriptional regulator [Luteolibacter rhizosphaerae]MCW1914388.1 AraC family transcriptional regulator [Luteolibacter rhizosphaerae]
MITDQQIPKIEEFRSWPALAFYVDALSRMSRGKVTCSSGDPAPADLCAAEAWSLSLPKNDGAWLIRVDRPKDPEGPLAWREPALIRMLSAMQENLGGPRTINHWPAAVRATWQLVTGHPCRPMTLAEVASCVGLSAGYLGEQFEKITGSSFKRILRDERMARACEMLEDSGQRIAEIAAKMGGLSLSQFNRSFVAATGISPTEWRRNYAVRKPAEYGPTPETS